MFDATTGTWSVTREGNTTLLSLARAPYSDVSVNIKQTLFLVADGVRKHLNQLNKRVKGHLLLG